MYGQLPCLPIDIEYWVTEQELIDKSRQSYAWKLQAHLNWVLKVAKDVRNLNVRNDIVSWDDRISWKDQSVNKYAYFYYFGQFRVFL